MRGKYTGYIGKKKWKLFRNITIASYFTAGKRKMGPEPIKRDENWYKIRETYNLPSDPRIEIE